MSSADPSETWSSPVCELAGPGQLGPRLGRSSASAQPLNVIGSAEPEPPSRSAIPRRTEFSLPRKELRP
ncbi:hypothetical protein LX90_004967 [Lentzea flava]|nr:hypothetical protein [Lentzea flava]